MEATIEHKGIEKYSDYKDSGTKSIGPIPVHWEIGRLKENTEMLTGYPFKSEKYTSKGIKLARGINVKEGYFDWKETRYWQELDENLKPYLLKEGDILISMDGSKVGKNFCFVNERDLPILLLQRVARLRTKKRLNQKFLYWNIASKRFLEWINISKTDPMVPHIAPKDINNFLIFYPPLEEQIRIANFLDQKTEQIDKAIAQKEKLIELLKERKQIMIQKAVTRGLNPDIPLKDSGVEWIGKIPEHWEVRRSKFLFTQRKERARKDDIQLSATQAYGVIPQEEYEEKVSRRVVKAQFHLEKRKHVELDDFVISMRSFQGGLERAWASGCIRSSYIVLMPLDNIDAGFYSYFFKTPDYIKALQSTAIFIRDGQDLNFDNFSRVDVLIPPLNEQKQISLFLETQSAKIDRAISFQEKQILKLKEYKSTLIDSAVTGKIKV